MSKVFCMKLGNLTMDSDFTFPKINIDIAIFSKTVLENKNGIESFYLNSVNCKNFEGILFHKNLNSSIINLPQNPTNLCSLILCSVLDLISDIGFLTIKVQDIETLNKCTEIIHETENKKITKLYKLGDCFKKIITDDTLHLILSDIFDGGYHCSSFTSNTLKKNDKCDANVHCGYPYYDLLNFPQKTILGVQCIWTLDNFTVENGATRYKKNSHKNLHNPHSGEYLDSVFTAPKGTMIIYLSSLWYSGSINTTSNSRSALMSNFTPEYIPVLN